MKRIKSQAGFGVIEVLLVLVALGIVGFAGYYVYNANNKANASYEAADQSTDAVKADTSNIGESDAAKKADPSVTTKKASEISDKDLDAAAQAANPEDGASSSSLNGADNAMMEY